MEFKLNEFNRDINTEDLLNDLISVAKKLNKNYVSRNDYEKNGKFSATPFLSRFGSWITVLEKAGLDIERKEEDFKKISDSELITDVQNVAKYLQKNTITTGEYQKIGKYRIQTLLNRFKSWNNILLKANLDSTGFDKKITIDDLFSDIEYLWTKLGKQPTTNDIKNGLSKFSLNTFTRKFGSWRKALEAFVEYINNDKEEIVTIEIKPENKGIDKNYIIPEKSFIKRKTNRDINLRLRFRVLQRDNFKCKICGKSPANDPSIILHVDHIIPWAKEGETIFENLQTLCSKCNLGKSDLV